MAEQKAVVFKDERLKKLLKEYNRKFKNARDLDNQFMAAIAIPVFQDIIDHFEQEEGPDGKWQDWSDAYRKHLQRIGRADNQILQFSGDLRKSFKPTSKKYRKVSDGMLFFTDIIYAKRHDEGLKGMPKRTFMYLSDSGLRQVSEIALQYLLSRDI